MVCVAYSDCCAVEGAEVIIKCTKCGKRYLGGCHNGIPKYTAQCDCGREYCKSSWDSDYFESPTVKEVPV